MMLTEEERQLILSLIDARLARLGTVESLATYRALVELRRKLEGVDKRVRIDFD
jgi:hypothetical protein